MLYVVLLEVEEASSWSCHDFFVVANINDEVHVETRVPIKTGLHHVRQAWRQKLEF
jgi:hypothetical protein